MDLDQFGNPTRNSHVMNPNDTAILRGPPYNYRSNQLSVGVGLSSFSYMDVPVWHNPYSHVWPCSLRSLCASSRECDLTVTTLHPLSPEGPLPPSLLCMRKCVESLTDHH